MSRLVVLLSAFSAFSALVLYLSGSDIVRTLSPQGCRMSWMSPSYVLQSAFDTSWSPFAKRYSLWLYREVGWQTAEVHPEPICVLCCPNRPSCLARLFFSFQEMLAHPTKFAPLPLPQHVNTSLLHSRSRPSLGMLRTSPLTSSLVSLHGRTRSLSHLPSS